MEEWFLSMLYLILFLQVCPLKSNGKQLLVCVDKTTDKTFQIETVMEVNYPELKKDTQENSMNE